MFRIGDFARLSQVSVKTLRFYDEVGLLKPTFVDGATGYRYYSADLLPRLNRILALKDLGFSLEQIEVVLSGLTLDQLRGMLKLRTDISIRAGCSSLMPTISTSGCSAACRSRSPMCM